ncbi:MAG: hypothetical protein MZU97_19945 [Bacillus subtilis]|nr:hypothetical protein [Bacillus subtilis]
MLKRSEAQDSDTADLRESKPTDHLSPPRRKPKADQDPGASPPRHPRATATWPPASTIARTSANSHGLLGFAYRCGLHARRRHQHRSPLPAGASPAVGTPDGQISTNPNARQRLRLCRHQRRQHHLYTKAGRWDHTDYVPDVIILNMGTNDFNAPTNPTYDAMTLAQKQVADRRLRRRLRHVHFEPPQPSSQRRSSSSATG